MASDLRAGGYRRWVRILKTHEHVTLALTRRMPFIRQRDPKLTAFDTSKSALAISRFTGLGVSDIAYGCFSSLVSNRRHRKPNPLRTVDTCARPVLSPTALHDLSLVLSCQSFPTRSRGIQVTPHALYMRFGIAEVPISFSLRCQQCHWRAMFQTLRNNVRVVESLSRTVQPLQMRG